MATEFSNIDFKFRYGTRDAMKNTSLLNGSFNICTDTGDIYVDIDNHRICSSDIISGYTESEVRAIANPGTNIYYTSDSHELMMYDSSTLSWIAYGKTVQQANCDGAGNVITTTYATITALNALTAVVGNINSFEIVVLTSEEALPEVGKDHTIYFVPDSTGDADTKYNEFVYITSTSSYEKIGISTADLTNYYTKTQTDNNISTAVTTGCGNVTTATSAKYISDISIVDNTVTFKKGNGSTAGTLTMHDTTYGTATSTTDGIMKLYTSTGTNTDGTITQAAITTAINNKVDTVSGKGLSTNDYTSTEKTKLATIETSAQVNTITGVKGNSESSYRTGNVNITAANIGLGNVNNTADSAKTVLKATSATNDSAGNVINTTYIKGLSVSGKVITYTKGDGTTATITTQDTNTTYATGTATASGITKLYTGTGTNTDGTITQAAISAALPNLTNYYTKTQTDALFNDIDCGSED